MSKYFQYLCCFLKNKMVEYKRIKYIFYFSGKKLLERDLKGFLGADYDDAVEHMGGTLY